MNEASSVTQALDELDVPYRVFKHPGPIASLEQAARERGQRPEQVVRSLLFRLGEEEFVMVLVAGPDQVSWPALRHYLGQSRLTMASQEDVFRTTGYKVGAVSPFGLPKPLRVLVDEGVLTEEEVSIGSGIRGLTVILRSKDLMHALVNAEVGQFRSPPS
jgi:Cys-tRNA(Pro)/Cys-tRNA(Cys) deacylase